jgi:hypothetical protein
MDSDADSSAAAAAARAVVAQEGLDAVNEQVVQHSIHCCVHVHTLRQQVVIAHL